MAKYTLRVPEVHYQDYTVEAASIDEALENFDAGEGEVVEWAMEYSHILDPMTSEERRNWVILKDGKAIEKA